MFSLYIFFASVTLIRRIQLNFAFGFFLGGVGVSLTRSIYFGEVKV